MNFCSLSLKMDSLLIKNELFARFREINENYFIAVINLFNETKQHYLLFHTFCYIFIVILDMD